MKNLILDFANLTAIVRFGAMNKNSETLLMSDEDWTNFFLDTILINIANYIHVLKSDRIIITLENRSWRKTFYPLYKANRDAGKEADDKLDLFYSAANKAAEFIKDYTNIKVIRATEAEGDDIVAVLTQQFANNGEKTTIVSTDGDFKQLLRYKNVKIFNPIKKTYVSGGYSHLEYITKLIKGDAGDNVPSSYPRIKKEILEQITLKEELLEIEFNRVDYQIKQQRHHLGKFLNSDIPDDLSDDEWLELLEYSKDKKIKLQEKIKLSRENKTLKDDPILNEKNNSFKAILKNAKLDGLTESRLFSKINSFRDGFKRNKKLICLKIDNIPEHVTTNILDEYNKSHVQTKQSQFLKFVRKHKLREFAFGFEWNTLKSVKDV